MHWIILFTASWILFFLLVDWKTLKTNIWCGLFAMVLQYCIDSHGYGHKLYEIVNPVFRIKGSSIFFILGPVFVMGMLVAQYHPGERWMTILNVLVLSGLYSLQELILLTGKALVYKNWHFVDSLYINTLVIGFLSWFSIIALNKKGRALK